MNIKELSNKYNVKQLNESDIKDIISLMLKNDQYYKYHKEDINEELIKRELISLPLNKTLDDKHYLGFYDKNVLICVLDLIEKYPNDSYCYIGFFMMNKDYQGKGKGTKIIKGILKYLHTLGYRNIRLGVDKDNPQSNHFWLRNGFVKTGEEVNIGIYSYLPMEKKI